MTPASLCRSFESNDPMGIPIPSLTVIELLLPQQSLCATKVQLQMHPMDYALLQRAAQSQQQSLSDFIQLAIYLHARDVVAETQARITAAPALYPTADI